MSDSPRTKKPAGRRNPRQGLGSVDLGGLVGQDQLPPAEPRVPLSTRIYASTLKDAKLAAVQNDIDLQDLVDAAIREKVSRMTG